MTNFHNINYLAKGTPIQQQIFVVLQHSGIMQKLAEYNPVLTGTFPIGLNIPGSDLDIICEYTDQKDFIEALHDNFASENDFRLGTKQIRGVDSVIARFIYCDFRFEIFGQAIAVEQQFAYRHMLIEYRILQEHDAAFRKRIIEEKTKGLSTEEAFAKVLKIEGDPYLSLLDL